MNGEIMSMRKMGPGTRGRAGPSHAEGGKMSKGELWVNLTGWDGDSEDKDHLSLILTSKM